MCNAKVRLLELFGGIGACTQAFKRLNIPHKIVDYVEIDKFAVKSYNAMNGTNFVLQDIRTWDKILEVDFIMHGSPCQDFSVAGLGRGGDEGSGTRSSLLYETLRITEKLKPQYVLWENVKNVLSKKHRHNFDNYLNKMAELGYTNYYQVLNAKDYNIPQNRERVFVLSMLNDTGFVFPPKIERTRNLSDVLEEVVDEKFYINNEKADKLISQLNDLKPQTLTANYRRVEKQDTVIAGTLVSTELVSLPGNFGETNCVCVDGTINEPDSIDTANCTCSTSSMGTDKPLLVGGIGEKNFGSQYRQGNRVYDSESVAMCLTSQSVGNTGGNSYLYAVSETRPCLTPDRVEKRQNGRRLKEDGEDMFTLTSQDRHGILQIGNIEKSVWDNPEYGRVYHPDGISPTIKTMSGGNLEPKILQKSRGNNKGNVLENCPTITSNAWEENHAVILDDTKSEAFGGGKFFDDCPTLRASRYGHKVIKNNSYRIRKLTPKECWRLMGFSDKCFEKAETVNSNSQLYKQAGNSIVVDVLVAILDQAKEFSTTEKERK